MNHSLLKSSLERFSHFLKIKSNKKGSEGRVCGQTDRSFRAVQLLVLIDRRGANEEQSRIS
jgi:hypothetical protein